MICSNKVDLPIFQHINDSALVFEWYVEVGRGYKNGYLEKYIR